MTLSVEASLESTDKLPEKATQDKSRHQHNTHGTPTALDEVSKVLAEVGLVQSLWLLWER